MKKLISASLVLASSLLVMSASCGGNSEPTPEAINFESTTNSCIFYNNTTRFGTSASNNNQYVVRNTMAEQFLINSNSSQNYTINLLTNTSDVASVLDVYTQGIITENCVTGMMPNPDMLAQKLDHYSIVSGTVTISNIIKTPLVTGNFNCMQYAFNLSFSALKYKNSQGSIIIAPAINTTGTAQTGNCPIPA